MLLAAALDPKNGVAAQAANCFFSHADVGAMQNPDPSAGSARTPQKPVSTPQTQGPAGAGSDEMVMLS